MMRTYFKDVPVEVEESAMIDGCSRLRVLWSGVHGIATLAGSGKLSIITADSAMDLIDDLIANYVAGVAARRTG